MSMAELVHRHRIILTKEPLAKLPIDNHCHAERSEESRIFRGLRSFTPFRMTEKLLLQEAKKVSVFSPSPLKGWGGGEIAGYCFKPIPLPPGEGELLRAKFCKVSVGHDTIGNPAGAATKKRPPEGGPRSS
jgi:hypothetical protein